MKNTYIICFFFLFFALIDVLPDPPRKLRVQHVTSTSALVTWEPSDHVHTQVLEWRKAVSQSFTRVGVLIFEYNT